MSMTKETKKSIITEDAIETVLKRDKGQNALLDSWHTEDFANQGATSAIRRVSVRYKLDNKLQNTSYIAKMNLGSPVKSTENETQIYFKKEEIFYTKIAPVLREVLEKLNRELRVPRCLHCTLDVGQELILMEDLSLQNFGISKCLRKEGMDLPHALLVVRELATLHGASVIAVKTRMQDPIESAFPPIARNWFEGQPHRNYISKRWADQMLLVADLAEKEGDRYKKQVNWLRNSRGRIIQLMAEQLIPSDPKFSVLIHNDCWFNNILFRYNNDNAPVEAVLVDLQMTTVSTPVIDLLFFMYISLCDSTRKEIWRTLLEFYYKTFKQVLTEAGIQTPFSLHELEEEHCRKIPFGVILAIVFSQAAFARPEDRVKVPRSEEEVENYFKLYRSMTMSVLDRPQVSSLLKARFFCFLDDLAEFGIV